MVAKIEYIYIHVPKHFERILGSPEYFWSDNVGQIDYFNSRCKTEFGLSLIRMTAHDVIRFRPI